MSEKDNQTNNNDTINFNENNDVDDSKKTTDNNNNIDETKVVPQINEETLSDEEEIIEPVDNEENENTGSKKKKPILKGVLIAALVIIIAGLVAGIAYVVSVISQVDAISPENFEMYESSVILDKNGDVYQELQGIENREIVSIEDIPEHVKNAFIAIEDERFYSHNGVDIQGTTRAVFGVLTTGSLDGPGGSTITQQLIKLTHLTSAKTIERKIQEMYLALQLERELTKDQILEYYLNLINLSEAWGVEAASQTYFNKSVGDISIAQAAVLAAIPQAPTYYNPYVFVTDDEGETTYTYETNGEGDEVLAYNPNNLERALDVVKNMYNQGLITQEEYEQAVYDLENNTIGLTINQNAEAEYSYFTDAVYTEVVDDLMEEYDYTIDEATTLLLNGGLVIKSTVDPEIQTIMEDAAADDSLFPAQSYTAALASEAATIESGEEVNYIPQVGMTVIENETGYVVGIVGGREKNTNLSINRALEKFQTGSSTKPLTVYGPGVDTGIITLGTVYEDVPISIGGWTPGNSGGGYEGPMTVREGLTKSKNVIAVQAHTEIGNDVSIEYGEKLGMEFVTEGDYNDLNSAALALGGYTEGQSSFVMANAFSTFPNGGVRYEGSFYSEVVDRDDNSVLDNTEPVAVEVFSAQTAYLITDVLLDVVKGGTTYITIDGQEIAGKTGTTDNQMHAWFCGYTGYYSMAVWYGYDENIVTANGQTYELNIGIYGGSKPGPAYMFETVMNQIHEGLEYKAFPENPGGIVTASIDSVSGKLPTELTEKDPRGSTVISEMFIEGTVPTETDDVHVELDICTVSNQLAGEYCPDEVVETVVRLDKDTEDRFPAGVSAVDPDYVVASEAGIIAPSEDDVCTVHTANTTQGISFVKNGSPISSLSISNNESATVAVKAITDSGSYESISGITFSKNNSVVALSSNGSTCTVTGLKAGTSTITATKTVSYQTTIGEETQTLTYTYTDTIQVTVTEDLTIESVSAGSVSVYEDETAALGITVNWSDGSTSTASSYSLSNISNPSPSIATLSSDGTITGVGAGTCTITFDAEVEGESFSGVTCNVTVNANVTAEDLSMNVGQIKAMNILYRGTPTGTYTADAVISNTNSSVASVVSSTNVRADSSGTTNITLPITVDGHKDNVTFTVTVN
jgi:penicillin-binding protein 1A